MTRYATMSYSRQSQILKSISELANNTDFYSTALKNKYLRSFISYQIFEENFCASTPVSRHELCRIQKLRRRIETPDGLIKDDPNSNYPCLALEQQIAISKPDQMEKYYEFLNRDYHDKRDDELQQIIHSDHKRAYHEYGTMFKFLMIDAFSESGFDFDDFRSHENFPVVSKEINDDWDICWFPETSRTLLWPPNARPKDIWRRSEMDLKCYLRAKKRRTSPINILGFEESDIVDLRIEFFVIGFYRAYIGFNGVLEVCVPISARARLYEIISTDLEKILRAELDQS